MFSDEHSKILPALKSRKDLEQENFYLRRRLNDVEAQLYCALRQIQHFKIIESKVIDSLTQQGQL